jgi:hypothetical protein
MASSGPDSNARHAITKYCRAAKLTTFGKKQECSSKLEPPTGTGIELRSIRSACQLR